MIPTLPPINFICFRRIHKMARAKRRMRCSHCHAVIMENSRAKHRSIREFELGTGMTPWSWGRTIQIDIDLGLCTAALP